MTETEFKRIRWPARVVVHFVDGSFEELSGTNVSYQAPSDDPSGKGMLSFEMLPGRGQQRHGRAVHLPDIARIVGEASQVLWRSTTC